MKTSLTADICTIKNCSGRLQTAEELLKHGICADFVPGKFDGRYLAEELLQSGKISPEDKVVIFRAKDGTQAIVDIFENNNIHYTDISVYETKCIEMRELT